MRAGFTLLKMFLETFNIQHSIKEQRVSVKFNYF